jgi:hypothetical protein
MARKERLTHNRRGGSLAEVSSRLSPKQVNLRLKQNQTPDKNSLPIHSSRISLIFVSSAESKLPSLSPSHPTKGFTRVKG